jgi:hypothetical protein
MTMLVRRDILILKFLSRKIKQACKRIKETHKSEDLRELSISDISSFKLWYYEHRIKFSYFEIRNLE